MIKFRKIYLTFSILIFLLIGCSSLDKDELIHENKDKIIDENKDKIIDDEKDKKEMDLIKEKIKTMTLDEKIGQLFMVGIDDIVINENTKTLIENLKVGGIILFKRNINDSNQLLSLMNNIKLLNSQNNNIPLFFSVDEEGGRVSRLPDEIKKLPSSKIVGNQNNEEFAYKIGELIGSRVAKFGFNMVLTPVFDINSNPKNPVIGDRSFGESVETVSKLGVKEMLGIKSKNIIPVIKHFPGHGDTLVDSHLGLPVIKHDLDRLNSFELIPFKKAIDNGGDVIMIAHILLSKIDPNNPSTLSKVIINNILREDLKFKGVVMSDDLTMGAITKNYSIEDGAIMAITAGNDILTVCHGYDNIIKSIEGIKNAVNKGDISEDRIDESVYRILKLKDKYNLNNEIVKNIDIEPYNEEVDEILNRFLN